MSRFQPSGVITLTTDFGHKGPFVATMKGVMLTRFPQVRIIDLTHETMVYWPAEAGFWLERSYRYFPVGTVHVAIDGPRAAHRTFVYPGARDQVRRLAAYWAMALLLKELRRG